MTELSAIIAAGVAVYQASLPEYSPPLAEPTDLESLPNITLSEESQARICLACPLPECLDITDPRCSIRIEQLQTWRKGGQ